MTWLARPLLSLAGMTDAAKPAADGAADWDVERRYIRIVETHANGMVEFEFAVGEPHLYVEMVMPRAEFEQFCKDQGVTPTVGGLEDAEQGTQEYEWDWNLRAARDRHFRHEP